MASLRFGGVQSKPFSKRNVDDNISSNKIGNYALGNINSKNNFVPKYIGRSDIDLKERIKDHLAKGYKRYKFTYQSSKKKAFEKECENYHDFNSQLDNEYHPDRPKGTSYKCPRCNELD